MLNVTMEEFNKLDFTLYQNNPVIRCFGGSAIAADPSVLSPENSHDNKWHLVCHTYYGVYHFESDDGINFVKKGKIVSRAMRPDLKYIDGTYYMYYERVQILPARALSAICVIKWKSEIYLIKSKDLVNWSKPTPIIEYSMPYQKGKMGTSISNPFLVKEDSEYRLYYSANLSYLSDCKFCEPTYIALARATSPDGPFVSDEKPIMSPSNEDKYNNKGCGCIKVYKVKDGYIALQNGIYMEGKDSHSMIMLLNSDDGINFRYVKPLIVPQMVGDDPWMAQYVYASNLTYYQNKFYIHFNARNVASPLKGKEHIGIALAQYQCE